MSDEINEAKDGLIPEPVQMGLRDQISLFLTDLVRKEKITNAQTSQFLLEETTKLAYERWLRIVFCSQLYNFDPETVVRNRIEELIDQFSRGDFVTGTCMSSFRREDIDTLKTIASRWDGYDFKRDCPFSSEERRECVRWFEAVQRKNERQSGTNNRIYCDGKTYKPGEWFTVGKKEDEILGNEVQVTLPLVGGQSVIIKISSFSEECFPRESSCPLNLDIPVANAMFYYGEEEPRKRTTRGITLYDPVLVQSLYKMSGSYSLTYLRKENAAMKMLHHFDPSTLTKMRDILAADVGLTPQVLEKGLTANVLWKIHSFVRKFISGEEVSSDGGLDELIKAYTEDGFFPGDCKSVAALIIGFGEAINIPGRAITGGVDGIGGHVWAEQYIPFLRSWVPNDPAVGAFYVYPDKGNIYILDGEIVPDSDIQLSVTFSKPKESTKKK